MPSRSPNARYGPVSHGIPGSGSPLIARHEPPRWAFTLKRNAGWRRLEPGGDLGGGRLLVERVVQLDRAKLRPVVAKQTIAA